MITFDTNQLALKLRELSPSSRTAFALAAATRLLPCFERYEAKEGKRNNEAPRRLVNRLWAHLEGDSIDAFVLDQYLNEITDIIPEEVDFASLDHALADDAASAVAYAIRSALTADSQESMWAAQRAYEAADQIAIRLLKAEIGTPEAETQIQSHPIVQRELVRQASDLDLLRRDRIGDVKQASFTTALVSNDEAATLARSSAQE
jgi:uncharacterized protein YjaG (DUF416 family)